MLSLSTMDNPRAIPLELRRLKANIALLGFSMTELSDATGIPYASLSRIINGRVRRPAELGKVRQLVDRELQFFDQGKPGSAPPSNFAESSSKLQKV
jgi:hypothetical protein